eukprot:4225743-Pyramimonas_sp.AAC.1
MRGRSPGMRGQRMKGQCPSNGQMCEGPRPQDCTCPGTRAGDSKKKNMKGQHPSMDAKVPEGP